MNSAFFCPGEKSHVVVLLNALRVVETGCEGTASFRMPDHCFMLVSDAKDQLHVLLTCIVPDGRFACSRSLCIVLAGSKSLSTSLQCYVLCEAGHN